MHYILTLFIIYDKLFLRERKREREKEREKEEEEREGERERERERSERKYCTCEHTFFVKRKLCVPSTNK